MPDLYDTLLLLRLNSLQYDLGQQIRVDFEKAFSVKGAPVSVMQWYYSVATQIIYWRGIKQSIRGAFTQGLSRGRPAKMSLDLNRGLGCSNVVNECFFPLREEPNLSCMMLAW